jgi:hypothetical protein
VYEPALCCNTGVCGTEVDQSLVSFTADIDFFKQAGVEIQRHNLANDPQAFVDNPVVLNFLEASGSDSLPLVLVDNVTVLTGQYPSREMLARYAGFRVVSRPTLNVASGGGCCGGGGSC